MNHQNVSVSLLPFTHPYPHGSLDATIEMMREGLGEGQLPHGWLFQATWTMVRNGEGVTQYGDIHTAWPDAAHGAPVGAMNVVVRCCMGSLDNLGRLKELGRVHEPTPERLRNSR